MKISLANLNTLVQAPDNWIFQLLYANLSSSHFFPQFSFQNQVPQTKVYSYTYIYVSYTQLCPTLGDPMDCSLPVFSIHGILQAKLLGQLPFPPPGDLPDPGIEPMCLASPALAGGFFTTAPPGKPCVCVCVCVCVHVCVISHYSHARDSDPMDYTLQASSVCGISQARILKWVAISFSGDLPNPGIEPMSLWRVLYHQSYLGNLYICNQLV